MDSVGWLVIALCAIGLYLAMIYVLNKKKLLEKFNLGLAGPILMIHTERGKRFIEWVARVKRFWRIFGNASIMLCVIAMLCMSALLIWEVTVIPYIPKEKLPSPQMYIGLPGVNPIIPLWYGLIGLVVAIIVHEFSHGILARVGNVEVKSLGLLLLVLPIGAFVEPDEDELKKIPRRDRARVFAAGPTMNIIVALVCALIFSLVFMSAVQPVASGIMVTLVDEGWPAGEAGIRPGMLILGINGTPVRDWEEFDAVMATTHANQTVRVDVYHKSGPARYNVTLANKYEYYTKMYPDRDWEEYNDTGFLGIMAIEPERFSAFLANPLRDTSSFGVVMASMIEYGIALPIKGILPLRSPMTDAYVVNGPLSVLPVDAFWVFANMFYWIFWLNIMIGTFNTLPMLPLDGGYIFNDGIDWTLKGIDAKKRDKVKHYAGYAVGLFFWGVILWMFILSIYGSLVL